MIVSKKTFFLSQHKLTNIPFNQTEEWFDKCCYSEDSCIFLIDDISSPQIGCWGTVFKRRFIGKHLIIHGESYINTITSHHIREFYNNLILNDFSIIEISSFQFYDIKFEIGIRRAGFLRPMLLRLSPLTISISTTNRNKTHKTWNRNLRLASDTKLTFSCIENPEYKDIEIFCNIFNELKTLKKLNYELSPSALKNFFVSGKYKLFFVRDNNGKIIAGRIVYISGENAYDVHAANSYASRECGAAYFIIEEIIKYLANIGIKQFDYGMISPSNNEMDDIYRAKSYSGGDVALYNGQWIFYRSKILEYLLNGYYYFIKKINRY